MSDAATNTSHAEHYVNQSRGQHGAIVRLQEDNARLTAEVGELREKLYRAEWLLRWGIAR